jgi:hypothetical protein
METQLQENNKEWEKLQEQIENNNNIDADLFSALLKNYLERVKQVRGAYVSFCKKIF